MTRRRHPRIPCLVPFCRRGTTRFAAGSEFICGRHWALVDTALKRFRRRRAASLIRAGASQARIERADAVIWRRIRRQAVERAAGAAA